LLRDVPRIEYRMAIYGQAINSMKKEDSLVTEWEYLAVMVVEGRKSALEFLSYSAVNCDGNVVGVTTCGKIRSMGRCDLEEKSCEEYVPNS
jgi:hypothetical protein